MKDMSYRKMFCFGLLFGFGLYTAGPLWQAVFAALRGLILTIATGTASYFNV